MSKKLTTSTNDVLDTLALDEKIQRIDVNGDYTLHISDNVKLQQYAIYGTSGTLHLTFDRPIVFIYAGQSFFVNDMVGFGCSVEQTYVDLFLGDSTGGVSIVYCFGVVYADDLHK